MVGGPNCFAAGQYTGTPIEAALPVKMDIKDKKRFPTVAVAMVIEDLEEPGNVNMSIEAAKADVDLLDPQDQVGVEDCNGTWRIPMQYVTDRAKIKGMMAGLTDMNDPPVYDPYIMEAAPRPEQHATPRSSTSSFWATATPSTNPARTRPTCKR